MSRTSKSNAEKGPKGSAGTPRLSKRVLILQVVPALLVICGAWFQTTALLRAPEPAVPKLDLAATRATLEADEPGTLLVRAERTENPIDTVTLTSKELGIDRRVTLRDMQRGLSLPVKEKESGVYRLDVSADGFLVASIPVDVLPAETASGAEITARIDVFSAPIGTSSVDVSVSLMTKATGLPDTVETLAWATLYDESNNPLNRDELTIPKGKTRSKESFRLPLEPDSKRTIRAAVRFEDRRPSVRSAPKVITGASLPRPSLVAHPPAQDAYALASHSVPITVYYVYLPSARKASPLPAKARISVHPSSPLNLRPAGPVGFDPKTDEAIINFSSAQGGEYKLAFVESAWRGAAQATITFAFPWGPLGLAAIGGLIGLLILHFPHVRQLLGSRPWWHLALEAMLVAFGAALLYWMYLEGLALLLGRVVIGPVSALAVGVTAGMSGLMLYKLLAKFVLPKPT